MALWLLSCSLAPACADDTVDLGHPVANEADAAAPAPSAPSLTAPPPSADGGDADAMEAPPSVVLACVGTECPAPYASCSTTAAFKCGTNLSNDNNNCGACGISCAGFDPINVAGRCIDGACAFECMTKSDANGYPQDFKNCNGLLDDGCEVNTTSEHDNCGLCGHACGPTEHCIMGKCGCQNGKTDCGGKCTDTRFDDSNCGACGTKCTNPTPACSPMPTQTVYGCGDSNCGRLKCKSGFADCNLDLGNQCASDGCETNVKTDPNNCGGCGIVCGPNQECRDPGTGTGPQCLDTCASSGLTQCGTACKDLLSDKQNCGLCSTACTTPPTGNVTNNCKKGICVLDCLPGYADCNGNPVDGCEVDLRIHPANCGACGNKCDYGGGQPCVEGKCLMVECDAGEQTK